ncbi:oligoribonuclease, partial [Burkholderia multivorans]
MSNDRIVWIDCEMTGLDEARDELIEIAAIVTDFELRPLDEGVDIVIRPSAQALENMNDFVTQMHTSSGLITELDAGTTVADAQAQVLDYVKSHVKEAGKAPLGGNSVGTDKVFLSKQMPELVDYLHYRIIDVSSIKELAKQWFPRAYFQAPEKRGGHRALGDIRDSIVELAYYRRAVFSSAGPTSD